MTENEQEKKDTSKNEEYFCESCKKKISQKDTYSFGGRILCPSCLRNRAILLLIILVIVISLIIILSYMSF